MCVLVSDLVSWVCWKALYFVKEGLGNEVGKGKKGLSLLWVDLYFVLKFDFSSSSPSFSFILKSESGSETESASESVFVIQRLRLSL